MINYYAIYGNIDELSNRAVLAAKIFEIPKEYITISHGIMSTHGKIISKDQKPNPPFLRLDTQEALSDKLLLKTNGSSHVFVDENDESEFLANCTNLGIYANKKKDIFVNEPIIKDGSPLYYFAGLVKTGFESMLRTVCRR